MADTPRRLSTLHTYFADNTSGDISAQDLRDGVQSWHPEALGVYNVLADGAKGDGSTDDTTSIQTTIDAVEAAGGGIVYFPPTSNYYKITSALTIDSAGVTIAGSGRDSSIRQTTSATNTFTVTASDTTFRDVSVYNSEYGTSADLAENILYFTGTSAASPMTNITIDNCHITRCEGWAVYMKWVDGFTITNNEINDIRYAGIMGLSVHNGYVANNYIHDLNETGTPYVNSYGISWTRTTSGSLATDPVPTYINVVDNIVDNNPNWHGIDMHCGSHITWRGNLIKDCRDNSFSRSSSPDVGCDYVTFSNNVVDFSGVDDPAQGAGILSSGGTPRNNNITIANNQFINCASDNNQDGAIRISDTDDVLITGNQIVQPNSNGILIDGPSYDVTITNNIIEDVWCDSGTATAILLNNAGSRGIVANNIAVDRGNRSGESNVNEVGINYNIAGLEFIETDNILSDMTTRISNSGNNTPPT